MSEIRYIVKNTEYKELVNAAIEYIESIQDFKEAQAEAEKLKEKYMVQGYPHVGIDTWIECTIELGSNGEYSYATYARAKTVHSSDYSYVSQNSEHAIDVVSRNYTKQRNELGQNILDILAAQRKAREELAEFKNNVLREIIYSGEFSYGGKDYAISEKPEQEGTEE